MLTGMYVSAAGMMAQEYRQRVTSNNLANAQTHGFKRDMALLQSRANAVDEDPQMSQYRWPAGALGKINGGVLASPTYTDMTQGNLTRTGQQTDLALQGSGFFMIQGDGGERFFTRDGNFTLNSDGQLVTADGRSVLGANGQSIKINPDLPFTIDEQGQIKQGETVVNQLAIMTVKNQSDLYKVGDNLMALTDGAKALPATTATTVRQGYLEQSGVDPISELTEMMTNQRFFEANAKMIQSQDATLQVLNTVGRIS